MIVVEDLVKTFGRDRVLNAVSLRIDRGERVALVGANGAGKTTLIRCLLGEYVCRGRLQVDGLEPRGSRRTLLRRIGFVPQLPPPLKMPIGELLGFAAALCGEDPRRMEAVSRGLGFEVRPMWRQLFTKLSGGQQEKLLIAIALGRDSDILIMDEPAANLDPQARRAFLRLLREREGCATMLLSSHRLDEIASLVGRVVELEQGRVTFDESVGDPTMASSALRCRLVLARPQESASASLRRWGFREGDGGIVWEGEVAGSERLRFLSMLSRYAGLIRDVALIEGSGPAEGSP